MVVQDPLVLRFYFKGGFDDCRPGGQIHAFAWGYPEIIGVNFHRLPLTVFSALIMSGAKLRFALLSTGST